MNQQTTTIDQNEQKKRVSEMKMMKFLICAVSISMILTGCTKQTIEEDPFVLGANPIVSVELTNKATATLKADLPLTSETMHTSDWTKTQEWIIDQTSLRLTLVDDQGYKYLIYSQESGDYLALVVGTSSPSSHRYRIPQSAYTSILLFMSDAYWPKIPGVLDFVSAMWAKDETTLFSLTKPTQFQVFNELHSTYVDLSRFNCNFSLVDQKGNVYRFYEQANVVEVVYAVDGTKDQYSFDSSKVNQIQDVLITNYADKLITNQLQAVNFTKVYLDGLSSYSPSKLIPITTFSSDQINQLLVLNKVVAADVLPVDQSTCPIVLKSIDGLYYVVCYDPYVVGVGSDPKGPLTYYNLFKAPNDGSMDVFSFFTNFPLPAPSGVTLDSFNFSKAFAMTFSERELSVPLSGSQNSALKALMDLQSNGVLLDRNPFYEYRNFYQLFGLVTPSGLIFEFWVSENTEAILLAIDFNGYDVDGSTYYLYEGVSASKIMEAYYGLSVRLFPDKVDLSPTFDAYYVGNATNYANFGDNPLTALTSTQITQIDGLLQVDAWKSTTTLPSGPLPNHIDFALRKSPTEYYLFSRYGSMSIVVDYPVGEEMNAEVYTIPNAAYDQLLNALKGYK